MYNMKKYLNFSISILLGLSIFALILSFFIHFILVDKNIYLKLFEKNNTYNKVKEIIYNKMDSTLGMNLSDELKESIINDKDIKNEADNVLNFIIDDMKTGQTNIPISDTSVYKDRIVDAINSFMSKNNSISYNGSQYMGNVMNSKRTVWVSTELNVSDSNAFKIEKLATREELEAQGREILRQKGLTEAEARKKLTEKGMTEGQVWKYLEDNGYLDEGGNQQNSDSENAVQNEGNGSNNIDKQDINGISNEESSGSINPKSIDDAINSPDLINKKLKDVKNKLIEQADKIILEEIQKLNFSKVIQTQEFSIAVKITSFLYKSFYPLLFITILLISIVILLYKNNYTKAFKVIGISTLIPSTMLITTSLCAYKLQIYNRIDIGTSNQYLKDIFSITADYFLKTFSIVAGLTIALGMILYFIHVKKDKFKEVV